MLKMYGIKNCDTIKKARQFLQEKQIKVQFHDYRTNGLDSVLLQRFIDTLGYQAMLNTRGTTWRKLDESTRNGVKDNASAAALMLACPALIKRPLLRAGNSALLLGFTPQSYTTFLQEHC